MQNSDLFIVLGTRMGIRICGYAYETVARAAKKVMVDIDPNELEKPTFRPDVKICADAGDFLRALAVELPSLGPKAEWLDYCRRMKAKYPVILPEHRARTDYVSSYVLPEAIMRHAPDPLTVVTSNGIAYTSTFQAIPIRKGMRMFSNEACASMGYGLPAAIGAAFADAGRTVVCFDGDGSIQMNIQELQTLLNYKLPVKLFVYNNGGYLSIKTTQRAFFNGRFMGSEAGSGVILPSFEKIAAAYGLPYFRLKNNQELDVKLPEIFATEGPALVVRCCRSTAGSCDRWRTGEGNRLPSGRRRTSDAPRTSARQDLPLRHSHTPNRRMRTTARDATPYSRQALQDSPDT